MIPSSKWVSRDGPWNPCQRRRVDGMRKIFDLASHELKWSQPSAMKEEFELRTASELVATLHFRSSLGSFATAESADGCWTFKRIGFWQSKAGIRQCGSDVDLAIFKNNTWKSGGTLAFANGHQFNATTNFWQTRLGFETETGDPLAGLRYGGVFRRHADVEITAAGRSTAQLPVLVLFGWYLAIMLDRDSSAATASGGA